MCSSPVRHWLPYGNPFDLHVLGTPPAFILSQDQTLHLFLMKSLSRLSSLSLFFLTRFYSVFSVPSPARLADCLFILSGIPSLGKYFFENFFSFFLVSNYFIKKEFKIINSFPHSLSLLLKNDSYPLPFL